MKLPYTALTAAVICVLASVACTEPTPEPAAEGVVQARALHLNGVDNLYRVCDDLYRSGQPDEKGFAALEKLGVRSVLNLREYHKDTRKARLTGLHLMAYPVAAGEVTAADVEACLRLLQEAPKPVLVHCWHGADRTGIIVAAYRIVYQGWSVAAAEREFMADAYGHHEFWYGNLVKLLRGTDWAAMRSRLLMPAVSSR